MSWYDSGMLAINNAEVLGAAELIRQLYAMPGCDLGGPLHAMLDDGNIDDEQIHNSYYQCHQDQQIERYLQKRRLVQHRGWVYTDELVCPEDVADLCRLILASFRRMPRTWRAAAIAWADGTITKNLRILIDNPDGACRASTEQVEALIAELCQAEGASTATEKTCAAIPCGARPDDIEQSTFNAGSGEAPPAVTEEGIR